MKKLLRFVFAILFAFSFCANATTIDFYSDGTITDGNVFNTVNIWNDANVTMTGGDVGFCKVYNSGVFNYSGGDLVFLYVYNSSVAYISTAENYYAQGFELYNNGQIYMNDGGDFANAQIFDKSAQFHIYGSNLKYIIGAPDAVEGLWPDGRDFEILIRNSSMGALRDSVFLHEIPEPASMGLLLIGIIGMRRFQNLRRVFL
jgi:hypothetical protein